MSVPSQDRRLRVAQVAPLWFTVPPERYGGIERIVSFLAEGLVERGHDVTLFAAPGSRTSARLIEVYPAPLSKANIPWSNPIWNLRNLSLCCELAQRGEFDVVHVHLDLWGLFFERLFGLPVVHTMHNPLYRTNADATRDDRLRLFDEFRNTLNLVFISESARKLAMVEFPMSRVIYNGIDMGHFAFNERGGDHFIWIARLNKHKGVENAIVACEQLGAKLLLAGRIDPTQEEYFQNVIRPHLGERIQYVGELSEGELSQFYGSAKALLYPIEWEEPFGLVVAEAMACGTPVIAYRRGSMAELIKDGSSGFVIESDIGKLVEAMKKVDQIDRKAVRAYAEANFSKERMIGEYEKLYYELCQRRA